MKAAHALGTVQPEGKKFALVSAASGALLPTQLKDKTAWTLGVFFCDRDIRRPARLSLDWQWSTRP